MKRLLSLFLLLASIFLVSCGGSGGESSALFRFIPGSPNSPAITLNLDGAALFPNRVHNTATQYVRVDPGAHTIDLLDATNGQLVLSLDILVQADSPYTLVTYGNFPALSPFVLVDIPEEKTVAGESQLRFLHNSPNAPAIDLYIVPPGASIVNLDPDIENLPPGALSSTVAIFSAEAQILATVTGTKTVAIDTGTVAYASEREYTIIANEARGGGAPLEFLVLEDA